MSAIINRELVRAAIALAQETGRDIADVSLDEIARRAGISRTTLYRRISSRRALDDAVRAAGVDPGGRPGVRDRAASAAAEIIREAGLGALTLEAVAARAGCSVPALHSQLGGRDGLLAVVFERYHPLPRLERLLAAPPATFEETVRAIHAVVFDTIVAEPALLRALIAEVLTHPTGPPVRRLAAEYLPRAMGSLGHWLMEQVAAGRCRPWPMPVLAQTLLAPIAVHAASRELMAGTLGLSLPPREETIELFMAAFCRAVMLPSPDGDLEESDD